MSDYESSSSTSLSDGEDSLTQKSQSTNTQDSSKPGLKVTLKIAKDTLRDAADSSPACSVQEYPLAAAPKSKRRVLSESESDHDQDQDDEEEAENNIDEDEETRLDTDDDQELENDAADSMVDSDFSRVSTPDQSRLTKRQRSKFEDGDDSSLMALPTDRMRKKHLSAEEQALRRTEMARRRKHLSDKRVEEEKMDTINRLLRKQATKSRKGNRTGEATPAQDEDAAEMVNKPLQTTWSRWVSTTSGIAFGIPDAWLGKRAAGIFAPPLEHQQPESITTDSVSC